MQQKFKCVFSPQNYPLLLPLPLDLGHKVWVSMNDRASEHLQTLVSAMCSAGLLIFLYRIPFLL